jgi:hypothetical protein
MDMDKKRMKVKRSNGQNDHFQKENNKMKLFNRTSNKLTSIIRRCKRRRFFREHIKIELKMIEEVIGNLVNGIWRNLKLSLNSKRKMIGITVLKVKNYR